MYKIMKSGGRKSAATLAVMLILTVVYLLQYPQITAFMLFDYYEICFDMTYIHMYPRMSTGEYIAGMVTLIGLFGASNAAAYYGGEQPKPTPVVEPPVVDPPEEPTCHDSNGRF